MKIFFIVLYVILGIFGLLIFIALVTYPFSIYANKPSEKNTFEGKKVVFVYCEDDKENADGVKGHLVSNGDAVKKAKVYSFFKRLIDIFVSFFALILLSPILLIISVAVFVSDPGPIVFTQKRVGKNKRYFKLHTNLDNKNVPRGIKIIHIKLI